MRSGVVVAGGRSTRFGGADKAVATLAGTPMVRRVADRLLDVVGELVVNCRPDQTPAVREAMAGYPLPVRYGEDEEPDRGPVAGIRNGLREAGGEYAAVVACDMPFVEPALLEFLFDRAAGADAAVPRLSSGWFQTTQAVYRTEAMVAACDIALEAENPRILRPIDELEDVVVVEEAAVESVASTESFENINTPDEFAAAAERLRERER
ncbi:molybdenum cofactor guanylyltransferase [Halomicroarcula sp. GCM10025817]|uniref:molybdenum cofactor guanylyltransferase n=1 Tax=Haloarcula TaxID=2237 RepID=UPI0023E8BAA0|nr:molybdenum cofactor guanylyltransferase [Halomicroarcula sp. SYNS111]